MTKFAISTDSTADLYAAEVQQMGLYYLPLTLTIEEKGGFKLVEDRFADYNQYVDFFNTLRAQINVKTSMNNYETHYDYFRSLAENGVKDLIHFTISYGLAPTMDVANQALNELKSEFPHFNVAVIESNTATIGQGMLVKLAYKMQQEGATFDDTVKAVQEAKRKVQHFIMVDDLFHLKRGGRVSGAAAAIGTMIQLKVILTFDKQGKLSVLKKVMGGRKKAIKTIVEDGGAYTFAPQHYLTVVHTDNIEGAEELALALEQKYGIKPEIRIMGPTIGCHVGPGALAYAFISNEERPL